MNSEDLRRYIRDLQQSGFDVVRLKVQLQEKFAFPLNSLIMAVLAIPFALAAGKRGLWQGLLRRLESDCFTSWFRDCRSRWGMSANCRRFWRRGLRIYFWTGGRIFDTQSADVASGGWALPVRIARQVIRYGFQRSG